MRKVLLFIGILISGMVVGQSITYPGNGKNGFGGAVGMGSLTIRESFDTITFRLNRGPGLFDSLLVFYIDEPSINTGISSTSNIYFTGTPDKYSVAASGRFSSTQQSVLSFPANFKPDMAVVFDKFGGKIFFLADTLGMRLMQDQGSFTVFPTGSNNSPTYQATTYKSQYGMLATDTLNFNFMGTYIGQTASRSNEGFGDPFTNYISRVDGYNPYTVQGFFNFSTSQALPVSLVDFKAIQAQGSIQLKWTVAQEINIDEYQVQRSANGRDFTTISSVKARNSSLGTQYSVTDAAPVKGNNYYRLRIVERGGAQVSKVVVIRNGNIKNGFSVVQLGTMLNVQLQGLPAADYKLIVINTSGQVLQSSIIKHNGIDATQQVELKNIPVKGIYRVVLQSGQETITQSILLQ